MRVLVVVAHPRAESFTHASAERFCAGLRAGGHQPDVLDLYREGFDPVVTRADLEREVPPTVREQQVRLGRAQGVALVYPLWWAAPPALLQGWLQRVLTQGFAFAPGAGGCLRQRGQLIVSVGSRDATQYGRYIEPMLGVLTYCGLRDVRVQANWGVYTGADPARLQAYLAAAEAAGRGF